MNIRSSLSPTVRFNGLIKRRAAKISPPPVLPGTKTVTVFNADEIALLDREPTYHAIFEGLAGENGSLITGDVARTDQLLKELGNLLRDIDMHRPGDIGRRVSVTRTIPLTSEIIAQHYDYMRVIERLKKEASHPATGKERRDDIRRQLAEVAGDISKLLKTHHPPIDCIEIAYQYPDS